MDYDREMLAIGSLCKSCRFRICRLIEMEDGEMAYQNTCLLMDMDMVDYTVLECNRFEREEIRLKWPKEK